MRIEDCPATRAPAQFAALAAATGRGIVADQGCDYATSRCPCKKHTCTVSLVHGGSTPDEEASPYWCVEVRLPHITPRDRRRFLRAACRTLNESARADIDGTAAFVLAAPADVNLWQAARRAARDADGSGGA